MLTATHGRAIGQPGGSPRLDKVSGMLLPRDCFLLCSDGLSKTLDDAAMAGVIMDRHAGGAAADPARALVSRALEMRARDNVTAVVVEMPG